MLLFEAPMTKISSTYQKRSDEINLNGWNFDVVEGERCMCCVCGVIVTTTNKFLRWGDSYQCVIGNEMKSGLRVEDEDNKINLGAFNFCVNFFFGFSCFFLFCFLFYSNKQNKITAFVIFLELLDFFPFNSNALKYLR